MIENRRSDRLFIPIPVSVSGEDQWGKPFEEKTWTIDVCRHGACINLDHVVKPDERLNLKTLRNDLEGDFRVVGSVQGAFGEEREWGLGSSSLRYDFWGIEFPDAPERFHPQVLLQCAGCTNYRLMKVSRRDYEALLEAGQLSSYCGSCAETAQWRPTPKAFPTEPPGGILPPPADQRKYLRRSLTMLLKVRNRRNGIQTVQTFDASNSGLGFTTRTEYRMGERIYLTLPFSEAWQEPLETKGRTIRAARAVTALLYGVQYDN